MKVDPAVGKKSIGDIVSWFSEDYSIVIEHEFDRRSTRVLNLFIEYIEANARSSQTPYNVIYFHNFSGFDGILLIRHLVLYKKYKLKPLMRNNELYELAVYYDKGKKFTFRDETTSSES